MKKINKKESINKKVVIFLILFVLVLLVILYFLIFNKSVLPPFAGVEWERTTEYDTEFITFHEDGRFSYYYGVGNAVGYYDVCETYKYDEKKQTIEVICDDEENSIIKIISYDDNSLKLEIENDIREFSLIQEVE